MDEESLRVWLEMEDGEEREFEVVGTFYLDDQDYMALLSLEEGEEGEVYLIGFHGGENDEVIFDPITDDELYQEVSETFEDLFLNTDKTSFEENDVTDDYRTEMEEVDELMEDEEYCYQDEQGNLFIFDEQGRIVYLDEFGEPIPNGEYGGDLKEIEMED